MRDVVRVMVAGRPKSLLLSEYRDSGVISEFLDKGGVSGLWDSPMMLVR